MFEAQYQFSYVLGLENKEYLFVVMRGKGSLSQPPPLPCLIPIKLNSSHEGCRLRQQTMSSGDLFSVGNQDYPALSFFSINVLGFVQLIEPLHPLEVRQDYPCLRDQCCSYPRQDQRQQVPGDRRLSGH